MHGSIGVRLSCVVTRQQSEFVESSVSQQQAQFLGWETESKDIWCLFQFSVVCVFEVFFQFILVCVPVFLVVGSKWMQFIQFYSITCHSVLMCCHGGQKPFNVVGSTAVGSLCLSVCMRKSCASCSPMFFWQNTQCRLHQHGI